MASERGNHHVAGGLFAQPLQQFRRAHKLATHFHCDALAPQYLASVRSRNAQPDVADVFVRGEILVGEDETLHGEFFHIRRNPPESSRHAPRAKRMKKREIKTWQCGDLS